MPEIAKHMFPQPSATLQGAERYRTVHLSGLLDCQYLPSSASAEEPAAGKTI